MPFTNLNRLWPYFILSPCLTLAPFLKTIISVFYMFIYRLFYNFKECILLCYHCLYIHIYIYILVFVVDTINLPDNSLTLLC
jgi:hypothetical protein